MSEPDRLNAPPDPEGVKKIALRHQQRGISIHFGTSENGMDLGYIFSDVNLEVSRILDDETMVDSSSERDRKIKFIAHKILEVLVSDRGDPSLTKGSESRILDEQYDYEPGFGIGGQGRNEGL